jgi:DedD protein
MALPSFLKRKASSAAQPKPPADGVDVQQARIRARRRLLGAAVLLVVGVITFPLLFETQPRPIPLDVPIEMARKEGPAAVPASPRPAKPVVVPPIAIDPNANVAAETPAVPASTPAASPAASVRAVAPEPAPPPKPVPKPAPVRVPVTPAKEPAKEPSLAKAASSASAAEPKTGRFVVQVGAFADPTAAREVRLKVERLGLKTYTQVVDTEGGKRTRVRIGPFESREDANKVLAKLKTVDLPGAVLTL